MRTYTLRNCLLGFFTISVFAAHSQNVAINTNGHSAVTGAILDLSDNLNTAGTTAFLAPYVTLTSSTVLAPVTGAGPAGLLVYNTSASTSNGLQGAGYYYWTGSAWVYLYNNGSSSTLTSANNGLSVSGSIVQLGGPVGTPAPLLHTSVISGSGYNLDFDLGTYTATGTGAFLVTNGGTTTPLLSVTSNTPGVGINVNPAVSTLDDNGSFGTGTVKLTPASASSTNLANTYNTIIATPSAAATTYTLVLPSAVTYTRREYHIVYNGNALGTIDITSGGGAIMVNGTAVSPFLLTGGSVTFQSDGTNWDVTGDWGGGTTPFSGAGTLNYLARWTPNGNTLGTGVSQDNGVTAAINTTATAPVAGQMLTVTGNATATTAILGSSSATGGIGVKGSLVNGALSGGYGVYGTISSLTAAAGGQQYAVYGLSTVTAGNGYGVYGAATGANVAGINYGGYFTASGTTYYGLVVPSGGGFAGFGTITPINTLDDAGSFGTGTLNIAPAASSTTTLTNAYSTIIATPTAAATVYTLQLPSATANPRRIYTIVYNGSAQGTINITSPVSGAIEENGAPVSPLALVSGSVVLQSDGSNWNTIAVSAGGTLTTANNGLSVSGTTVQLGTNSLLYNTTLPLGGYTLTETSALAGTSHTIYNTNSGGTAFLGEVTAPPGTGGGIGVYGSTTQSGGYGLYGYNGNPTSGAGVFGDGTTYGVYGFSPGIGVYGFGSSTGVEGAGSQYGVYGTSKIAVYGDANNAIGSMGGDFSNNGGGTTTYAAYYDGTSYYGIYSNQLLVSTAGKSTVVEDTKGDTRLMYCSEAPELLFQDFGTASLVNGRIHIDLDPIYAKNVAINEEHPLRVIITMNDECPNSLYVTNRTATGFDVVEMNHGTSNASFTYEVIANRADDKKGPNGSARNFSSWRFQPINVPAQAASGIKK